MTLLDVVASKQVLPQQQYYISAVFQYPTHHLSLHRDSGSMTPSLNQSLPEAQHALSFVSVYVPQCH